MLFYICNFMIFSRFFALPLLLSNDKYTFYKQLKKEKDEQDF